MINHDSEDEVLVDITVEDPGPDLGPPHTRWLGSTAPPTPPATPVSAARGRPPVVRGRQVRVPRVLEVVPG
ncbi:hypothetical protein [Nonomuraea sp. NPDC050310]|uniref:hypothetical protein n=1 Tax=Nonomuraea sp. NPDC050310 TaxID=3154935 RepID=UPI0033F9C9E8